MKGIKYIACILIIAFALTGCQQREKIVYQSECLTISRLGAHICVVDHARDRTIYFTLHKVRRAKNAAMSARTILQEDDYRIISVSGQWIIETPAERTIIRW